MSSVLERSLISNLPSIHDKVVVKSKSNLQMTRMPFLRLLFTGDSRVGKTLLLICHERACSPQNELVWIPSTHEHFFETRGIDGTDYRFSFWDSMSWGEEYDRIRRLVYPSVDINLICFSLVDLVSYENVRTKWYPYLREYNSHAVVFLVGTKKDLRDRRLGPKIGSEQAPADLDQGEDVITYDQGSALGREIGAEFFVECSSFTAEGVKTLFEDAFVSAVVGSQRRNSQSRTSCIIV